MEPGHLRTLCTRQRVSELEQELVINIESPFFTTLNNNVPKEPTGPHVSRVLEGTSMTETHTVLMILWIHSVLEELMDSPSK